MLNSFTLNESVLNSGPVPIEFTSEDIMINTLGLQNESYSVHKITDEPQMELNDFNIPQNNGKGFLSYFKRQRTITLGITIKATNESDFIVLLDNLRKECFKSNSTLYFKKGGGEKRQIKVNCISFPRNFEHFNVSFLQVDVQFTALEPFWYEGSRQSKSLSNKTGNFTEEISNLGNEVSEPIIYILINTASLTGLSVGLGDNTLSITQSITDGDIIIIDSENKEVWLNSSQIDYDGTFLIMGTGSNFFNFSFTGSVDTNVLILNKKNYV